MQDDLKERLRAMVTNRPDSLGICTAWHRNPDGPEAADHIASLEAKLAEKDAQLAEARAENARLRAWSLKAFTVVEWCCGEGYALPDPHFCCDDTLMEGVSLLGVETSDEARAALEQGEVK